MKPFRRRDLWLTAAVFLTVPGVLLVLLVRSCAKRADPPPVAEPPALMDVRRSR